MIIYIHELTTELEITNAMALVRAQLYGDRYITFKQLQKESDSGITNSLQSSNDKLFVFIGHASKSTYGEGESGDIQYTPQEFVEKIVPWIPSCAETLIFLGCELGFLHHGNCQALEITRLLVEKKNSNHNLANLRNYRSYLLSDNKFMPNKMLSGMVITLLPDATMNVYAWDSGIETQLVELWRKKYDLKNREENLKLYLNTLTRVFSSPDINMIRKACVERKETILRELKCIGAIEIKKNDLCRTLHGPNVPIAVQLRNNLIQEAYQELMDTLKKHYEDISPIPSNRTIRYYYRQYFKCLRALQNCELLLNIVNLIYRDNRDATFLRQCHVDLTFSRSQLESKCQGREIDPSTAAITESELGMAEVEKTEHYDNLKCKLSLLVEPDLYNYTLYLKNELTRYENVLISLQSSTPDNYPRIQSDFSSLVEQVISPLREKIRLIEAQLAKLERDCDNIKLREEHLIDRSITIMQLLSNPEYDLLNRIPHYSISTAALTATASTGATRSTSGLFTHNPAFTSSSEEKDKSSGPQLRR